jgi:drug/metabolite transporter (DMT)-like permease
MSRLTDSLSPKLSATLAGSVAGSREAVDPRAPTRSRGLGVGILLAAFGAIAFSGKAIIVKLGYRYGADAITLITLRMLCALPFFIVMGIYAARRPGTVSLTRRDQGAVLALGVLGYYLASYLDFLGLEYVSASLERLILYLNPTIVLFIGLLFFGRRVRPRQVVALLIGYAGVVLAFTHDFRLGGSNVVLGSALVFASALSYALYLVGSGEIVKRVGTLRLTAYASSVASICCIAHFLVTRPLGLLVELPPPVYGLSLLNGTACTVLPVFAVMAGISRVGASIASQVGMIGPVSTILLANVFLGERMGPTQVVGTILVMIGVFIVSQSKAQAPVAPNPVSSQQGERGG